MNKQVDVGLLLLRLVLGLTFFIHGFEKFQGGISNIAWWFQSMGLPGFAAYVVAIIELAGGLAIILGLGTRIVSVLFSLIMLGAIVKVKFALGFIGNGQMAGYELDVALLFISIYLALTGKTMYSLDNMIFRRTSDNTRSV
ncbi:DoxX family protein [Paenibacillus prosopidis]|uniref:Putative membrane protein YphA (DoxX/SURF4 family) n=1 Tax=Paenibacillus prosopidis TaxID=630520 RepID=A0A368VII9_9BACL|nr:DoxX family protein [Paenibacillus prosopidis]RCW41105.1 putative membrane protein YphA (DoxX/SURF4 family) [Paenibacillus prosopidis]